MCRQTGRWHGKQGSVQSKAEDDDVQQSKPHAILKSSVVHVNMVACHHPLPLHVGPCFSNSWHTHLSYFTDFSLYAAGLAKPHLCYS